MEHQENTESSLKEMIREKLGLSEEQWLAFCEAVAVRTLIDPNDSWSAFKVRWMSADAAGIDRIDLYDRTRSLRDDLALLDESFGRRLYGEKTTALMHKGLVDVRRRTGKDVSGIVKLLSRKVIRFDANGVVSVRAEEWWVTVGWAMTGVIGVMTLAWLVALFLLETEPGVSAAIALVSLVGGGLSLACKKYMVDQPNEDLWLKQKYEKSLREMPVWGAAAGERAS